MDAVSSEMIEETDLLAVKATKRFLENADVARLALQLYETQMIKTVYEATGGVLSAMQVFLNSRTLDKSSAYMFSQSMVPAPYTGKLTRRFITLQYAGFFRPPGV